MSTHNIICRIKRRKEGGKYFVVEQNNKVVDVMVAQNHDTRYYTSARVAKKYLKSLWGVQKFISGGAA